MANSKKTRVGKIENNIVYVEPNYNNSVEEYDVNGLNTYEFAPALEDYSIFVNLEVETRGRNVQSSKSSNNKKLILSFISNTDGTSAVNFMQGTKIPIGENGATINSLTTNYTDMFLGDLKKYGPSTETFGIESIDISYNSYMVPEVTIEFIDVRGVGLFAPREAQETNKNIDAAINSDNKDDIANTFFQCFFTFPYPKFTLLVKGFYGQPVSYELTCADFRARFDSRTGNFACTAKFVGYAFSFLNDVMINGIVAAPYSDYIGSEYWEKREFKIESESGGLINMPKIGTLLRIMKNIEADADKIAQSDPTAQQKNQLDEKASKYNDVEDAYNAFVRAIDKVISENKYINSDGAEDKNILDEELYYKITTNNGVLKASVVLTPTENTDKEFRDFFNDNSGQIESLYNEFIVKLDSYNSSFPNEPLPKPDSFYDSKPKQRVFSHPNSESKAAMYCDENYDIRDAYEPLFNKFRIGVDNSNLKVISPLLKYKSAYYYKDNKFAETLENYKKENAKKTEDVEKEIENIKEKAISKSLKFRPTVENMTKIVMAHFETFVRMIYETAKTICNENPSRTISSLAVKDPRDISDVSNKGKTFDIVVPPFPKVVTEVKREGTTVREEAWVGDYAGDFREKDLVHGIINGVKEISKDIAIYEATEESGSYGGSETAQSAVMKFPLSPADMIAKSKPYAAGGYDPNDLSSLLGLAGLRAISIFGVNNFKDWDENAKIIGIAEANNFLANHKLNKEIAQKLSNISGSEVVAMMKGDSSGVIKRPGDGSKPWPWRLKVDEGKDGIIANNGDLDICRIKSANNNKEGFAVPFQNLSWEKIKNEVINSPSGTKAAHSSDYINTTSFVNLVKDNLFTVDTNINRLSSIAEEQLKGIDGIEYYRGKFLEECKYNSEKYKELINNGDKIIAYIIENDSGIIPSDGSCMLPTSSAAYSDKSLKGGYDMDNFHKEHPGKGGDGWIDKNKNEVKRKGSSGYSDYLKALSSKEFTFTEFPGVKTDLSILTELSDPGTSIFGQLLYYKEENIKSRALLFLASLGYVFDYEKIIKDYIVEDSVTMCILPLPAIIFAGGLLWSDTEDGKKSIKYYVAAGENKKIDKTGKYTNSLNLLHTLRDDVQKRFIKIFEKWVFEGVENDSLLHSFSEFSKGLELHFQKRSPDDFFNNLGEIEEENIIGFKNAGWLSKYNSGYKSLMDLFKGELSDDFFNNYITIDEDLYGDTKDYTRGMRLGNRDGGASSLSAINFALAGCVFSKNSKFFKGNVNSNVNVNTGTLEAFFNGFLERLKQEKVEETNVDSQISQAAEPDDSNTDIKIGIYRYCKMLYDKWIAGKTDLDFNSQWSMESFFTDSSESSRYFYFIDAYYNEINFLPINIGNFCEEIVSSFRSDQYSLLSFLSSIYAKNKLNFLCVQNFLDLGKKENMEMMFDTVPYTDVWNINRHPNFIVMYPYESSSHLDGIENSEYENDGFMINQNQSDKNIWPEPLKSRNANSTVGYSIPAFGVSYGRLYQSYFKDIDVSMDNPVVTEQSIKAQFAIACQNNEGEQTGDRSKLYEYGQDLYSIYSNNSYTCNVTMMGCAWVQPLMYFVLNNIPMFRGTYLIEKVTHHIEPGNMVTKFMGVRMSNVCTRIARDYAIRAKNNQSGNGETNGNNPDIQQKLASVDNDCPYKEYPLIANLGSIDDLANLQLASNEMENAKLTVAAFVQMGYTDIAGAAVAGNIMQETHYIPKYVNKMKKASHNPGMKGGICQWQGVRLTHLVKWDMNATGIIETPQNMPSFGKQLMFIDKECNEVSSYKPTLNALKGATNDSKLNEVTEKFRANYEGGSESQKRIDYANKILKEYRENHIKRNTAKIANNKDNHISDLAAGFLNALNQTAAASSNNVTIGINQSKSSVDTLWLTNGNNSKDFSAVLDMILSAYSDKVSHVNWILPGDGQTQNLVPAAYLVTVKEGSQLVNIKVTSENNPNTPIGAVHVSKDGEEGGIHYNFCKALVKKYKSHTRELETDTNNALNDYDSLFNNDKYKLTKCNETMENAGFEQNSNGNVTGAGSASTWANAVVTMGKWYESNIHTYSQKTYSSCDLIGARVRHDCSGFVSACLQYFGAFTKGKIVGSCDFTTNDSIEKILTNSGFRKLSYSYDKAEPFDIISYCGHVEILAEKGKSPKSWSWGSCHDCRNGHACMPAFMNKKNYKIIWRYVG